MVPLRKSFANLIKSNSTLHNIVYATHQFKVFSTRQNSKDKNYVLIVVALFRPTAHDHFIENHQLMLAMELNAYFNGLTRGTTLSETSE